MRARTTATQTVFEVEDDEPGIPKSEHVRIFEPFARLTKVQDTGLDLAFIHRTVRGWGGDVTVADALGRGTAFSAAFVMASRGELNRTEEAISWFDEADGAI